MNPEALVRPELDIGVPHGGLLLAFAETIIGTDRAALDAARAALVDALGPEAISGASAIAGNFTKNDRVANGLGIPVDPPVLQEDGLEKTGGFEPRPYGHRWCLVGAGLRPARIHARNPGIDMRGSRPRMTILFQFRHGRT